MSYVVKCEAGDWEVIVGMEVHCQVVSNAKLFSGAATDFGAEPNSQVSLIDAAMPGMLPARGWPWGILAQALVATPTWRVGVWWHGLFGR